MIVAPAVASTIDTVMARALRAEKARRVVRAARVAAARKEAGRANLANLGQIITSIGSNTGRKTSLSLRPKLQLFLLWMTRAIQLIHRQWIKMEFTTTMMGQ